MTNHIEELMKAAGVEKQYYSFKSADGSTYNWELNENGNEKYKKHFIGEPELKERTFTPEKQLELIKLVLKKPYIEWEQYFENNKFIMKADMPDETYACLTIDIENTEYALALAEFITELLKIKRLDKSEVMRILEDD